MLITLAQHTSELYHELPSLDRLEHDYQRKLEELQSSNLPNRGESDMVLHGDELKHQICYFKFVKSLKKKPLWSRNLNEDDYGERCKWMYSVIPDAPYAITEEFMKKLFTEYNIDYIIHGDDPCLLPDGSDAYALARKAGPYKQIKRTEGVSSTDIVGHMLFCVRERSVGETRNCSSLQWQFSHGHSQKFEDGGSGTVTRVSHFLPKSRRIVQFSNGKGPGTDARLVYIDGAFDLFHAKHVEK